MDDRVAAAIAHWAPRFTTNGVTVSDFERITQGLDEWAGWCAAWSSVAAEHEALGRDALPADRLLSAGQHLSRAASREVELAFGRERRHVRDDVVRETRAVYVTGSTRSRTSDRSGLNDLSARAGW